MQVTETRRRCMPLDGTLDIWVLFLPMSLSIFAAVVGLYTLFHHDAVIKWRAGREGLRWIAVTWAIADYTPVVQFFGCGYTCRVKPHTKA
jgi:hypothetical protein